MKSRTRCCRAGRHPIIADVKRLTGAKVCLRASCWFVVFDILWPYKGGCEETSLHKNSRSEDK